MIRHSHLTSPELRQANRRPSSLPATPNVVDTSGPTTPAGIVAREFKGLDDDQISDILSSLSNISLSDIEGNEEDEERVAQSRSWMYSLSCALHH